MHKVLRIINRFNLGGPTLNAAYLTKYLKPEYETLLVGGQWDEESENFHPVLDKLGIEPIIIPEMKRNVSLREDRRAYKKIKSLITKFQPDIVHTHASKAGALGRLAAIRYGKAKIVHTFHGHVFHSYFNYAKTGIYKNIERTLASKTDKIIAISERQKLELSLRYQICPRKKIEVIPLGMDLNEYHENLDEKRRNFRHEYHLGKDEIAIGIIGRLVPIKNHRLFLQAIKKASEKSDKKIRAFIVGDGEETGNLKGFSNELGLGFINGSGKYSKVNVHFTSWVNDVKELTAGMDIIALSSFNEGTPLSLIEAQAAEKPIVSTKVGGVSNTVKQNVTALLSPSNDVDSFANNLLTLIDNKELRIKMGKKGWEFVKNKFHYTRLIEDMDGLYNRLLMKSAVPLLLINYLIIFFEKSL